MSDRINRKHLQKIILELLQNDDRCKADDIHLYCKVAEIITKENGTYSAEVKQLIAILMKHSVLSLPNFKTVLRYRQKFQSEDESLKIEPATSIRAELEKDFRAEFKG